ncbi:ATP-binding protein [Streptomyces sp. NPDC005483]|uniref:sensor histidine kinase n=1 Tax=Streptomyces sp. NPDC005483 TaxID=3154882 RepID=UPI0033B0F029
MVRTTGDPRKPAAIEDQPMEHGPVPLAELLEASGELARDLPGGDDRKATVIVSDVPWPLPKPPGDAGLLEPALRNLVADAVKYSGSGSSVELRAFEESAHVVVEVADTGQGIPAEELPYIWGELVQGSEVRDLPGTVVRVRLPLG